MSLLTATMIGAAILGADPEIVSSGPAFTHVTGHARFVSSEVIADEYAPVAGEPAPIAAVPVAVEAAPIACEQQPANVCYPAYASCEPEDDCWCPWCDCHDDDCEESHCDRHLQTYCIGPGDFYPHYPYVPVYHGYYYFRPYNHMHVEEAAVLVAQMGGDPRAPYSVEFLKKYFPPAPVENPIIPEEDPYPMLEDLLEPKLTLE